MAGTLLAAVTCSVMLTLLGLTATLTLTAVLAVPSLYALLMCSVPRDETSAYQVRAETSAGSQDGTVDQDFSSRRTIEVDTSAGDIDVRYP